QEERPAREGLTRDECRGRLRSEKRGVGPVRRTRPRSVQHVLTTTPGRGAAMRRLHSVLVVVGLGLAGALVVPGGLSAVPARSQCRPTAFVTNAQSGTVSTIDGKGGRG